MRGLRRIVGDPRFSADVQYTDLQVRAMLKAPSIDCIVSRMRLAYLGRIVRGRPRGLFGLLHLRAGAERLPWVLEVGTDCHRLREYGALPLAFPDLLCEPSAWCSLMQNAGHWAGIIDNLYFVESVTDRNAGASGGPMPNRALAFACARCDRSFASQKALESHCRARHGDRLDIRRYIRTAVCPACGTDFRDRRRCIGHLSDRRRPACADLVRCQVAPMPDPEVKRLNEIDKTLRRDAWRKGRSTHIATQPARRSDGRVLGRIAS